MSTTATILSVSNLEISFLPSKPALSGLSCALQRGKTLAIVGESGSGKSLTAFSLIGLLPPNASVKGSIILHLSEKNFDLSAYDEASWQDIRGKHITMVFQEPMSALNPIMKIGEQLSECLTIHHRLTAQEAKTTAIAWLKKVRLPDPEIIFHRYPHQLSGGQKQRVMIAMAMIQKPQLLIADEPTTALDVSIQKDILRLIKELQQEQETGLIFITHDLALAKEIADDVLVLYQGKSVEYGAAQQVLFHPQHPYTQALLACRPSVSSKGKRLPIISDYLDDIQKTVYEKENTAKKIDTPLISVKNLQIGFAAETNIWGKPIAYNHVVKGVNFDILKGETLGLVGESGCGKSTISKSLIGLIKPLGGSIVIDGKEVSNASSKDWQPLRRVVQMVFQDPFSSLNPRIKVGDMLAEVLTTHKIVPAIDVHKESLNILSSVQLPANALQKYPHEFSGGQRQRLGIARALAVRPQLLICDESVSALDVSVQAQILNLLKDLQAAMGLTYLFISHDLNVVYYISDRIMVMDKGHIVESGNATSIFTHPQHNYTKQLIASAL